MPDPVLDQLHTLGVDYEVVDCDPDLADTDRFCETYGFGLDVSANAIVVVGKSNPPVHVMCLALADSKLDINKTIRKKIGVRKASFASAEETMLLTGMEIGGVTPFGTSTPLSLWIDSRIMDCERVIVGGGGRDRKLLVDPEVLASLPDAEVVDGLAVPRPPDPS
jgi:prolyl-tRNA editing enzyme YbaK/EbsC (Cys-tRNA(Pro) deacylase)